MINEILINATIAQTIPIIIGNLLLFVLRVTKFE